ncbi:MAG: glycosyltransferase family 2 protein [Sphingobacteriales bacterium]|jgi:glycosyltransferase involved in cell wall biosynthesis
MSRLSVVVALYNEEDNIEPLFARLREALKGMEYELVMVDDGSKDKTIEKVKQHLGTDTKLVTLMKNYGQSAAMAAGIQAAEGEYIATMDGDLQNDPDDIPMMLKKLQDEEWDLVAGVRQKRQDGMLLRKIPSKIANALIRQSTKVRLHDYGCTLKVFDARIAKNLGLYGELHRFIPVLAALQGARMTEVPVKHHARIHGVSKYGIGRTSKVASDLVLMIFRLKYFQKPMHFFGPIGFLFLFSGIIINLYLLVLKIQGERIGDRPLLILGVILLLAGLLLLLFGIQTDIMMRTYYESQNKLPYQVRKIFSNQQKA